MVGALATLKSPGLVVIRLTPSEFAPLSSQTWNMRFYTLETHAAASCRTLSRTFTLEYDGWRLAASKSRIGQGLSADFTLQLK